MASKHDSILGNLLWKTDPLALAFGEDSKYTETIHGSIPTELNRMGSDIMKPFEEIDKSINPIRQIDAVDNISTLVADKPADALGMFFGAAYGAPALGSAFTGASASTGGMGGLGSSGLGSIGAPSGGATAGAGGMGGLGLGSIGGGGSSISAGSSSMAPATQGFMSSMGGDILTNVGSSMLGGLLGGGGGSSDAVVQRASRGSNPLPLLSQIFQTSTNVSPRSRRGGFL